MTGSAKRTRTETPEPAGKSPHLMPLVQFHQMLKGEELQAKYAELPDLPSQELVHKRYAIAKDDMIGRGPDYVKDLEAQRQGEHVLKKAAHLERVEAATKAEPTAADYLM
jgi:hypothetical protein